MPTFKSSQGTLQGSLVAIATPMQGGVGASVPVDYVALERLIDFHVRQGSDGLVVAGTTGEAATLTHEEHCELLRRAVQLAAGRLPIIAGTGANSTWEAIALSRSAHALGVDACLLITPYYNKPTQQGLVRHFTEVAQAVPAPLILYNIPGRTACDMLPGTVAELARLENVIGLKEASGELSRVAELRAGCPDDFLLFSGEDSCARDFILAGGNGVISVTANVAPGAMHKLCELALAGDKNGALEVNKRLTMLHQRLFLESNPIPVKWALQRMGLLEKGMRLPLTWLTPEHHGAVEEALHQAGSLQQTCD